MQLRGDGPGVLGGDVEPKGACRGVSHAEDMENLAASVRRVELEVQAVLVDREHGI